MNRPSFAKHTIRFCYCASMMVILSMAMNLATIYKSAGMQPDSHIKGDDKRVYVIAKLMLQNNLLIHSDQLA